MPGERGGKTEETGRRRDWLTAITEETRENKAHFFKKKTSTILYWICYFKMSTATENTIYRVFCSISTHKNI